jgi:CMP-N-acetylneuraminate monooxygenase
LSFNQYKQTILINLNSFPKTNFNRPKSSNDMMAFMINYQSQIINKPKNLGANSAVRLEVNGINLWYCQYENQIFVFYDKCQHMGGNLREISSNLVCSQHGWTYKLNGKNHNSFAPSLEKVKILNENDNELEILLPTTEKKFDQKNVKLNFPLQIQVHSHATIEFSYRKLSVLFDPWLNGPAYYGAWSLFPKPIVRTENLQINAIVITHPHPDHFHLPTLKILDKKTPVYFPKFPSGIIEQGLEELGFINQNPMNWDEEFRIGDYFKIKFMRPTSMWEDSATFTQVDDQGIVFSWLNLVDAGAVMSGHSFTNLDLLTSAFDQGASGYPLTWEHLNINRKIKMLEAQKSSTMDLLVRRSNQMNARYFLPFAGHWRLAMPEHQKYAAMIPHTTFNELQDKFKLESLNSKFLGVYPGEGFDFYSGEKLNSKPNFEAWAVDDKPSKQVLLVENDQVIKFRNQMSILQSKGEAFGVENIQFIVNTFDSEIHEIFNFVSSISQISERITIKVKIPAFIFNLYAEGQANWDHIAIGYWGEWNRSPDVYPTNFMRLLQSGQSNFDYSNKLITDRDILKTLEFSIADLIESNPNIMPYYLTRLGLPCLICSRSNLENLGQALMIHNIDIESNGWILRELSSLVLNKIQQT